MRLRGLAITPLLFSLALHAAAPDASVRAPNPGLPIPDSAPAYFKTGVLDTESRLWAQTQIERVWYEHRIWPKENPGPKPPFERMVPAALIEKKAAEPLRMSAALKQFWNVEITPAMLQNELERMERESKDRATLHELFAALRNDPFLIAETLARGNLAEKALRNHYAYDAGIHAEARARAEAVAAQVKNGAEWSGLDANYSRRRIQVENDPPAEQGGPMLREQVEVFHLPANELAALRKRLADGEPGALREEVTGWLLERKIADDDGSLEIESLFIPKRSFDDWWRQVMPELTTDINRDVSRRDAFNLPVPSHITAGCAEWLPTSTGANVPARRNQHTAVWTGSEMFIWGGQNELGLLNDGGRYNPATDSWSTIQPSIEIRMGHTAIWTGSHVIVWGGTTRGAIVLNTGGVFSPGGYLLRTTPTGANCPSSRSGHTAVWTGSEMIIWGGGNWQGLLITGGRYNPMTDSWLTTSTSNVPAGAGGPAFWTGSEMINGGYGGISPGGRYNPINDSWTAMSVTNAPPARDSYTAVWTGTEMILWGGVKSICSPGCAYTYLNSGGRYNPATNSWLSTSIGANVPAVRRGNTAIWTGNEMIVWGGDDNTNYYNTGGRYNPTGDSWTPTSIGVNVPIARLVPTAIWAGNAMIVWGGLNGSYLNGGGIYSLDAPGPVGSSLRVGKSANLDLNWIASAGAVSYNVKRCAATCVPATVVATPASNSYSEPFDANSYFYAVEAVNACGVTP